MGELVAWRAGAHSQTEACISLSSAGLLNTACIRREVFIEKRLHLWSLRFARSSVHWVFFRDMPVQSDERFLLEEIGKHCIMWPLTCDASERGRRRGDWADSWALQKQHRCFAFSCGRASSSGAIKRLHSFFFFRALRVSVYTHLLSWLKAWVECSWKSCLFLFI